MHIRSGCGFATRRSIAMMNTCTYASSDAIACLRQAGIPVTHQRI